MKTLKQHIKKLNKEQYVLLREMCLNSNSLYNSGLYIVKNYFKETGKYIGYAQLYNELKQNKHYKFLPAKIAQQILRLIDKNYRSFFALLRKKNLGQYSDRVQEPRYKKSNNLYHLILPNDQINLIKQHLKITKNIRIPFSHKIDGEIKQAIIKPKLNGKYYEIYITYQENQMSKPELCSKNYLSIDFGIKNFVSCVSNVGHSFIVNGNPIKSVNQFYNKQKATIQSELEVKNKKKWSNQLSRITINRDNYINNYFNQTVNIVKKYCLKHKIGTVIVGYNEGWKQEVNIGKINNQKFSYIPFYKFKVKLENKLVELGIEVIFHEESYTSKCSFFDNEPIKKHENYVGRRIKRGLFKTQTGLLLNSDVNGACNILKKVVSNFNVNSLTDEIVGGIVHPLMLRNIFLTQETRALE